MELNSTITFFDNVYNSVVGRGKLLEGGGEGGRQREVKMYSFHDCYVTIWTGPNRE